MEGDKLTCSEHGGLRKLFTLYSHWKGGIDMLAKQKSRRKEEGSARRKPDSEEHTPWDKEVQNEGGLDWM